MTGDWKTVSADDVAAFLNSAIVNSANPLSSATGQGPLSKVLSATVDQVRGTIASAGRVALSLTPGSVPPEAVKHVLVLTADALAASVPTLAQFVSSESFKKQVERANAWIDGIAGGTSCTWPSDPDPDATPTSTEWGDSVGDSTAGGGILDLSTLGPTVSTSIE